MKKLPALLSIGQLAGKLGESVSTVRRWCREGRLKDTLRTVGNYRRFAPSSYRHLLQDESLRHRKKIGYARVSGHDQKADLETQAQRLREYGCDEVITDSEIGT